MSCQHPHAAIDSYDPHAGHDREHDEHDEADHSEAQTCERKCIHQRILASAAARRRAAGLALGLLAGGIGARLCGGGSSGVALLLTAVGAFRPFGSVAVAARAGARVVGLVEARSLEHDADGMEDANQRTAAARALRRPWIVESVFDLVRLAARLAAILVDRHTAGCVRVAALDYPQTGRGELPCSRCRA